MTRQEVAPPLAMHLLASLSRSCHNHVGCFGPSDTGLASAQGRLTRMCFSQLGDSARGLTVLDVGGGLGGSARQLAAEGAAVTAIDSSAAAIEFARVTPPMHRTMRLRDGGNVRWHVSGLEDFSEASQETFDGVLMLEVLDGMVHLDAAFAACHKLLRPGGRLVVADFVRGDGVVRERVAAQQGIGVVASRDLTSSVESTPGRLLVRLERAIPWLQEELPAPSADIQVACAELAQKLRGQIADFRSGRLRYELTTYQRV